MMLWCELVNRKCVVGRRLDSSLSCLSVMKKHDTMGYDLSDEFCRLGNGFDYGARETLFYSSKIVLSINFNIPWVGLVH